MPSVNVILALIIVFGIIYLYMNSRQYLIHDGFVVANRKARKCGRVNDQPCHPDCIVRDQKRRPLSCNTNKGNCADYWNKCSTK